MFELIDTRYKVNSRKLQRAREKAGLNMSQFAFACDWSCSYQWQLENGRVETICEATKNVIEDALK